MAYERQYYTNGDVLDARQLNHMETGIKENSDNISKLSEDIANLKENGTGNGVTTAQANSLWALLKKTAFSEQLTDEELSAFKTTWGITEEVEPDTPTTYTITRNLTNCTSSSEVTSIDEGSAYTETITANNGYTLTGATVSVTMGGADITSSYFNGVLNISSVTGNIVITVSAVQETTEPDNPEVTLTSISATYTGGEVAVGTALTSLTGITVKATYSDGSTKTVTGYTLSGTIAEGENTITVSYGDKTTTFTVTGVAGNSGDEGLSYEVGYINDSGELATTNDGSHNWVLNRYDEANGNVTIGYPNTAANEIVTIRVAEYDINKNFVARQYNKLATPTTNATATFTLNSSTAFIRAGFGNQGSRISDEFVKEMFNGMTLS